MVHTQLAMHAYAVCNGTDYTCIKFGFTKQEPYSYMRSQYAWTYPRLNVLELYKSDNGRLFEATSSMLSGGFSITQTTNLCLATQSC